LVNQLGLINTKTIGKCFVFPFKIWRRIALSKFMTKWMETYVKSLSQYIEKRREELRKRGPSNNEKRLERCKRKTEAMHFTMPLNNGYNSSYSVLKCQ